MEDDELSGLARELVGTPSHRDPDEAGDRVERWLRDETDATVRRDDAGNVLAVRGGDGEGAPADADLALVGHHDVVPPADRQVDGEGGYVVEERDGRLHGRGSADMKGALAAAMHAFRDATVGDAVVGFASFVGEEEGGVGARHAIGDGYAPERAVVLEGSTGYSAPGVVDVAVAHKGRRELAVTVAGRAAHASEPDAGVNAVERACDVVTALGDLIPPETTVAGHRMRGTTCVTAIAGGQTRNAVPERCTFTVDERTVPDGGVDLAPIRSLDGVTVEVAQDLPPMECRDDDFTDAALAAARDVRSGAAGDAADDGDGTAAAPERVVKPHATDAGWLAEAGTDCVVIGPAEPGEAHTADESVSLAALATCRGIYRRLLERA